MQNLKDFFVVILFGSIFVYLLNNDSGLLSAIFDFIVSFSPLAWFIISVIVFIAAGYLIDQCNLKGLRIGDAEISTKHANFIINHGNANALDIYKLIKIIKQKVKTKFNTNLELEVKLLGFSDIEIQEIN